MSTSENAPKHVLRPGSARIRWGSFALIGDEGYFYGKGGERGKEREGGGMDTACFPGSAETLVRWGNISV